jgi:putative transposase
MIRTFRFRLLPNATQKAALARILADNCETYNAALQERREAWRMERKSINYYLQQSELTELRKDPAFQWIGADIQRDALRRIDRAFKAFFQRCKAGDKPGFPRFRSWNRYDSFTMGDDFRVKERHVGVPKVGDIRFKATRAISGIPKTVTVRRSGQKWTVSIACDIGTAPEKYAVSNPIGIDVGLTDLAVLSDGTSIENPRWTRKHAARIAAANRKLSLKQRRSKNRIRAREVLRRAHQRAADARKNYLHHVSKWLVQNYDLIAFEDLRIRNMVRSNMAKSIHDAAWGQLIWQIVYKAESAGKWAVPVNPRGTSQICSGCGVEVPKTLAERTHSCACGLVIGRDHNAGLNILALGMSAAGLEPSEHAEVGMSSNR